MAHSLDYAGPRIADTSSASIRASWPCTPLSVAAACAGRPGVGHLHACYTMPCKALSRAGVPRGACSHLRLYLRKAHLRILEALDVKCFDGQVRVRPAEPARRPPGRRGHPSRDLGSALSFTIFLKWQGYFATHRHCGRAAKLYAWGPKHRRISAPLICKALHIKGADIIDAQGP